MTRNEIVKKVANDMGITKGADVKKLVEFVNKYEETIKDVVASGEEVNLAGFMKLSTRELPERVCHLVKDEDKRLIPAHKTVAVKVSKTFKDAVK